MCNTGNMKIIYKKVGETPLEAINRTYDTNIEKYTYSGRLDPMAEGFLLIFSGEDCKESKKYYSLSKTYEYEFILGISTDTFDVLGKITKEEIINKEYKKEIETCIQKMKGKMKLPYPIYSSKTIEGKKLFEYARNNETEDIQLPDSEINIQKHELISYTTIDSEILKQKIIQNIKKVNGDFRQNEIIEDWESIKEQKFQVVKAKIEASGGTYIRAIVNNIGETIGVPTVAISINRTKIGDFDKVS